MIHVERQSAPPVVLQTRGLAAASAAEAFFEGRQTVSKQQVKYVDFAFDESIWQDAAPALDTLFHGKCAFCESPIGAVDVTNVGLIRPKRDALALDGTTSPDHYYWLAYDWRNLYLICVVCDRNKLNRFPVLAGRAPRGATGASLEKHETRLLLDPCLDVPEQHLLFGDEGHVASVSLEHAPSAPDVGTITIDTFGLNREDLVASRASAARDTEAGLTVAWGAGEERAAFERALTDLTRDFRPYAMACRQAAVRWLEKVAGIDAREAWDLVHATTSQSLSKGSRTRAFKRLARHEATQSAASIKDEATFARTTRITHVQIEDFRGIDGLEFEIPTTGWKMLIGENGTGKSSILQAVALALMGRRQAVRLRGRGDLDPKKLVRRGQDMARIIVHQAASIEPIEVTITRDDIRYDRTSREQKTVLLGFGSARWLPRPSSMPPETDEWIRVRNLLNPFVPLVDAQGWLRELRPGTRDYRRAEGVIRALLRLSETTRLRVVAGELRVEEAGKPRSRWLTFDQLSDGYQSALAMASGIMGPLFSKWDVAREAEGVVLVDELDAHLHPRWKMRIVGDLRTAFPNVQFLASTHDPLCLRGLVDREILSLRRGEDDELLYTDDLPSPKTMRVDQLLTSPFFGLYSTLDPDTERDLERYYDLLALDTRTSEQEDELKNLRGRVGQEGVLGDTPREQAVYAVVDTYIARQLGTGAPAPTRLEPATEERVAEILREAIGSDPDVEKVVAEILKA
jgi:predicted ATPase